MLMGRRRYVAAAVFLAGGVLLSSCHSPSTPPPPPPTGGPTTGGPRASEIAPAQQTESGRKIATSMEAVGCTASGRIVYNRRGSDGSWDVYTARPDLSDER